MSEVLGGMGVFTGQESNLFFTYNIQYLNDKKYELAAKFIRWSLSQGGPGITAMNRGLYATIVGMEEYCLEDVIKCMEEPFQSKVRSVCTSVVNI